MAVGRGAATVFRSAQRCWTLDRLLNTQWTATLASPDACASTVCFTDQPWGFRWKPWTQEAAGHPHSPRTASLHGQVSPMNPNLYTSSSSLSPGGFSITEIPTPKDIRIITHFLSCGDPQPCTTHTRHEFTIKKSQITHAQTYKAEWVYAKTEGLPNKEVVMTEWWLTNILYLNIYIYI